MKRDHKKIIVTFLLPLLFLYAVFQLYPLLLNLFYSMLNWNGITKTANFVGLDNYVEVLGDGLFWNAVKNSVLYAVAGTFFQVTVSFFLAYLVEYNTFKKKKMVRLVFIMPIVATSATIGILMKSIFSYDGFVNTVISGVGLEKIEWLTEPKWAFLMIILVSVWKETGTLFIYWMAGFQMVSPAVIEASKVDGASEPAFVRYILIPTMKPVIFTVTSVAFLNALKMFDIIQTLTSGGPYFSTDMISTYIYRTAFSSSFGAPRLSYASGSRDVSCIFDFVQWIDTILSKEVERRKRGMLKKILLFVSTAIWLAPFLLMLLIAFSSKNTNSFLELFADNRATFQNFQNAWEQAEFSRYFLNTVIVTVVSVVVILAVTALAGYIMGCFEFRAKKIIYTVMMISMGIPTIFFTIPVYQILRMLHCESSLIGLILAEVGG